VWPGGASESNGIATPEVTDTVTGRIENISEATITIYLACPEKNVGKTVVLCPGGGYVRLSAKNEGSLFAQWYASEGITAVVLKYRLPNGNPEIPLKDAQETIRILRRNAKDWNIDSQQIGISGFSAGGYLASTLLTHYDESCRPNFGILFYPVVSMETQYSRQSFQKAALGLNPDQNLIDEYSNEKHITADVPPVMMLLCDDDKSVPSENCILFYQKLREHQVPASLHIFPKGGHGFGFKPTFAYHEEMKALLLGWLNNL
jgi:acetyl esterase/lipase